MIQLDINNDQEWLCVGKVSNNIYNVIPACGTGYHVKTHGYIDNLYYTASSGKQGIFISRRDSIQEFKYIDFTEGDHHYLYSAMMDCDRFISDDSAIAFSDDDFPVILHTNNSCSSIVSTKLTVSLCYRSMRYDPGFSALAWRHFWMSEESITKINQLYDVSNPAARFHNGDVIPVVCIREGSVFNAYIRISKWRDDDLCEVDILSLGNTLANDNSTILERRVAWQAFSEFSGKLYIRESRARICQEV